MTIANCWYVPALSSRGCATQSQTSLTYPQTPAGDQHVCERAPTRRDTALHLGVYRLLCWKSSVDDSMNVNLPQWSL